MKNLKNVLLKLTLVQVLAFFLIIPYQGMAKESCLKLELKPGPYAVGFKSINHYDHSRTFYSEFNDTGDPVSEKARPVQISTWYPASPGKAKNAKPMRYKEYIYLLAFEKGFPQLTGELKKQYPAGKRYCRRHNHQRVQNRDKTPSPGE